VKNMKKNTTSTLITLGALGLLGYLAYKYFSGSGDFSGGFSSGGGQAGTGIPSFSPIPSPTNQQTQPGAISGGSSQTHQLQNGAVLLPIGVVSRIPGGVVSNTSGTEGLLIKGRTTALFIVPGAKQTASFMNQAFKAGKTFPLNKR
jgi:hypothetical protein